MKLPSNNLNYPVRILAGTSSGSGFIVGTDDKNNIYIVTAKHVLYYQDPTTKEFKLFAEKIKIVCNTFVEPYVYKPPRIYELSLQKLIADNHLKQHSSQDIVVIKFGERKDSRIHFLAGVTLLQNAEGSIVTYELSGARKFNDVDISNEIFALGYPVSLSTSEMKQINYDLPLVRKGIIAGKNYDNKTLILDCPVYGGNSGGLALEINLDVPNEVNIHLIGVIVQFVPFVEQWQNTRFPSLYNTHYQNSGYSIVLPVDFIIDLIDEIEGNQGIQEESKE
ncbi:MAG: Serine protease [Patescibacteria group bacterium]|nr:Serine protease [Patescibacteria group bacterium]